MQIAVAADMPIKAPAVAPPPPPSWTGFYVGGHTGPVWTSTDGAFSDPNGVIFPINHHSQVWEAIGGVQLGYNLQFAAWVAGVEGDLSITSINEQQFSGLVIFGGIFGGPPLPNTLNSMSEKVCWMSSLRGRLGWVGWNNLLFYGTGGVAWANVEYNGEEGHFPPTFSNNFISITQSTQTLTGWVAGGGVEYMISEHFSARAEYLYYGLHNRNHSASANLIPNPGAFPLAFQYAWSIGNIQAARIGLNYKF